MRKLYLNSHWRIGNTGIQLGVAALLLERFAFDTFGKWDEAKYELKNELVLNDPLWNTVYNILEKRDPLCPILSRFNTPDVIVDGYFQNSEQLVTYREKILNLFKTDTRLHIPIGQNGETIKDLIDFAAPIKLQSSDIVLHIRLGDYLVGNIVLDPAPQLALLRKIRFSEPTSRVIIVCEVPKRDAERNYLRLFEEFHPIFQHGTELEDFAILRSANRVIVTNSTFSWFAAYLGNAQQRWIPDLGGLKEISDTDILYTATAGYEPLDIPVELPAVSGEFFQGMCDYTIIDNQKKAEMHKWIDVAVPLGRQLFIEKEWPEEIIRTTKSLFVYVDPGLVDVVADRGPWPALRLLVFHNGDYVVNYDVLIPFLEKHPNVYAWVQNNILAHPQIRTLPIVEQNRIWRGGSVDWDPPVTISRNAERDNDILFTWVFNTNKVRGEWLKELIPLRTTLKNVDLYRSRLPRDEFIELLGTYKMVICPPGNGRDTHRHWETMMNGAWAIVQNNEHTARLLADYPSLPLVPIESIKDLINIDIPKEIPSPFHPLVLRPFWKTLFDSYICHA